MEIKISGQQYRELVRIITLQNFVEVILKYWDNEFNELNAKKVKLSKNTTSMLQNFILQLNSAMLNQKKKYIDMVTEIATAHEYTVDENTEITLVEDDLAIILSQRIADTKENE